MSDYQVILSKQDLAEFLEDNQDWMNQYRAELETRLATDGDTAEVEISQNALSDKITVDGEADSDEIETVHAVMESMVSDWGWLKQ